LGSTLRVAFGSMIGGVRYSRNRGFSARIVTILNTSEVPDMRWRAFRDDISPRERR
jgi:hypothetical protein